MVLETSCTWWSGIDDLEEVGSLRRCGRAEEGWLLSGSLGDEEASPLMSFCSPASKGVGDLLDVRLMTSDEG